MKNTHCLVTGGAGFIGSTLVDRLLAEGSNVRVLDNLSTGYAGNLETARLGEHSDRFEFIVGDASDADTVQSAVKGIDVIFHLSAMASVPRSMREPSLCHRWCATSTVELLAAGATAGVKRLILSSTSAAYGDSKFVSKRESDAAAPLSPYAAAKLSAENYCAAFGREFPIETVVLRYFNVFGPRQDPQSEYSAVIPRFVAKILDGERPTVYGDGGQSRDFVYVDDVVTANLLAATHPSAPGGTFNVGRGQSTTLLRLLQTLSELLGRPITPLFEPARAGDVRESLADITEIRTRLGFEPAVTIQDGLMRSIEYYRQLVAQHS